MSHLNINYVGNVIFACAAVSGVPEWQILSLVIKDMHNTARMRWMRRGNYNYSLITLAYPNLEIEHE